MARVIMVALQINSQYWDSFITYTGHQKNDKSHKNTSQHCPEILTDLQTPQKYTTQQHNKNDTHTHTHENESSKAKREALEQGIGETRFIKSEKNNSR